MAEAIGSGGNITLNASNLSLVLPLSEAGDSAAKKSNLAAIREGWAWAERQWSTVTKDTGAGNPHKASAEKGERYFKAAAQKIGQFFIDVSRMTKENLYS